MNLGDSSDKNLELGQILDRRIRKLKRIAALRQHDVSILLENVHDPHNIGAVLRSADAIGLREVYILYTEPSLQNGGGLELGKRTTAGTKRWVKVHYFESEEECLKSIRAKYDSLYATHLYHESKSIYDTDFTLQSCVIVFGNEHMGISPELLEKCDGNVVIPQFGMVESLNISVACAVILFEVSRQKQIKDHYSYDENNLSDNQKQTFEEYVQIHMDSKKKK